MKKLISHFVVLLCLLLMGCAAQQSAPDVPPEELPGAPGLPEEPEGVIPFAQIYYYEDGQASQFFYCSWDTANNTFSRGELLYTGTLHDDYIPEEWAANKCRQSGNKLLYTKDGQEQTTQLPENAPGHLCCAAVENGTVTAVYKEDTRTEAEQEMAVRIHIAHYPQGQPEAAEWLRVDLTEGEECYLSTLYTADCVCAGEKVYLEAGETVVVLDSRSGEVEQLDLQLLEVLCPEGSHSGTNGYYGATIAGYYDGVVFIRRVFVTETGNVTVVAAYRDKKPLAAILSAVEGGMDQLYLSDGRVLRAAGDFSLSSEGTYQGFLFPEMYWQIGF